VLCFVDKQSDELVENDETDSNFSNEKCLMIRLLRLVSAVLYALYVRTCCNRITVDVVLRMQLNQRTSQKLRSAVETV
jgi:hypothetical protein